MIFVFLIYEDLRSIKGVVPSHYSTGEKLGWIGIATLGYIFVFLVIVIAVGAALMQTLSAFKETIPF
jgi:hypothetical protein